MVICNGYVYFFIKLTEVITMKNVINYYYNMYPNQINQTKDYYYFELDGAVFLLFKCPYSAEEIGKIYELDLNLLANHLYVHQIIPNREGQLITKINNESYILLRKNYEPSNITIKDIINFSKLKSPLFSDNKDWSNMWAQKNDYLEYQTSMLGLKYPLIRESFSYYIGLAETAIEIVNSLEKTSVSLVYSHRRLNQNINFNFYNPLNIITDLSVRDAAEYFKTSFFNGKSIDEELSIYFRSVKLSTYEYFMFLARMIYPTYYFDLYEQIITGNAAESELVKITEKATDYENQIKKIYKYYKSFMRFQPIDWLEN